jgi:hypothetical protein
MRRFILLPLAVLLYNIAFSQSTGDYRSRQSGSWSLNTTWEKYQGGTWMSPSNDFPAATNLRTNINIRNTHTVTAAANLRSQASTASITIDQGGALNMGAYYLRSSSNTGSRFPSITINGTLSTTSYVSAVTFTVGATGSFITSYIGSTGWWSTTFAPTTVSLSGIVQFTGAANQRIPAYTYNNIIVSGTGAKIINGSTAINGLLTINAGATLNMAAYTLSLNGPGIILNGALQNSAGTLTFGGATQTISGTGSFSGTFANINIGTVAQSRTTLSMTGPIITNNLRIDKTVPNTGSSFTIGSASQVQVLTSMDIYIINGLTLKSDATNTASLIAAAKGLNGGNANANVELFLAGTAAGTMWHYISPPVSSAPATIFSSVSVINVTKFLENLVTTNMNNGWVSYEGWHFNTTLNSWEDMTATQSWSSLTAGNGYNYYSATDRTFTFSGQVNTANTRVTLAYNSAGGTPVPAQQGYNLIGNPFTSGIDWDAVVAANNIWNNVGAAIYFTHNGRSYTYVNGFTNPNDFGDGRYIPAMQGFFVKSNLNNITLTIPASAKVYTTHARYKSANLIPMIRLQVASGGKSDQSVIRFDANATDRFDNSFDARKLFPESGYPYIASVAEGNDLAINGLRFPADSTIVPLSFIAAAARGHVINSVEISALQGYNIWLNDKDKNISTELSDGKSYSFTSDAGKFPGRFTISFSKHKISPAPETKYDNDSFITYTAFGYLNIKAIGGEWDGIHGDVRVYDLTGREILSEERREFVISETVQIPFSYPKGIYIVEIRAEGRRFTGKFIKN